MSQCLSEHSVDHVVLERGRVANSWRTERWDSLRLLTPNWQSRLPGFRYESHEADGFMTMPEVIGFIEDYAAAISAPVYEETEVTSVRAARDGFRVATDQGEWRCQTVVLASGACNRADVPPLGRDVPPSIRALTTMEYRNPEVLRPGGVLVVGASATGVQLAEEIHRSGRPVTLAVGEHVRLPRTYRGRDILWWMEVAGILDQRYDEVDDIVRARNVPSPQLVGTPERSTLDLNALTDIGVKLVGPTRRRAGRQGAVFRRAAQRLQVGRPENEPTAEHDRRVGDGQWRQRRCRCAAPFRAHEDSPCAAARNRSARRRRQRRYSEHRMVNGVPRRLLVARPSRTRSQGEAAP